MPDNRITLNVENAREKSIICVAPRGTFPQEVTRPYLDLDMYVRIVLDDSVDKFTSVVVSKKQIADALGGIDGLFDAAIKNTGNKLIIQSMNDILGIPEPVTDITGFLGVAGTDSFLFGASAICFPEEIKTFCSAAGVDKCFVYPSSIHEIILQPYAADMEMHKMSAMVADINSAEVRPEEVLSDHAYLFNAATMEFTY